MVRVDELEDGVNVALIEINVVVLEHVDQLGDFNALGLIGIESSEELIDLVVLLKLFREEEVTKL